MDDLGGEDTWLERNLYSHFLEGESRSNAPLETVVSENSFCIYICIYMGFFYFNLFFAFVYLHLYEKNLFWFMYSSVNKIIKASRR